MKKLVLLISFLAISTHGQSVDLFPSIGVDYVFTKIEGLGSNNGHLGSARLKLGVDIGEYFAVQAHVGTGITDDTVDAPGTKFDVDIGTFFGLYAVGMIPITNSFRLYALAGVTTGDFDASASGKSIIGNETDFSMGIGGEYLVHEDDIALSVEYISFISVDGVEVNGTAIGLKFYF